MIHLGGKTAVVVPLPEYRVLAALRERASAEEVLYEVENDVVTIVPVDRAL